MSEVESISSTPPQVHQIRWRNEALEILIPKMLGIVWEEGTLGSLCVEATIDADVKVGIYAIDGLRFGLHAYTRESTDRWLKVFSVHLGDRSITDPVYYRHWEGRCLIMSWKRGLWEDRVASQDVEPRTFDQLMTEGVARAAPMLEPMFHVWRGNPFS